MQKSDFKKYGVPERFINDLLKKCGEAASKGYSKDEMKKYAKQLGQKPRNVTDENPFSSVAEDILKWRESSPYNDICENYICGEENVENKAIEQFQEASKLDIVEKSALMPDAHYCQGGVPVGSVLATKDCVIPGAVGYDISCMMKLTVFNIGWDDSFRDFIIEALKKCTHFGLGCENDDHIPDTDITTKKGWDKLNKGLAVRAIRQLGTSGSSNHFVDFGVFKPNKSEKRKLAILSHSGSRALGAKIAQKYNKIAKEKSGIGERNDVPQQLKNLGWLDLDTKEGQEYWTMMKLASTYATYCHRWIHERLSHVLEIDKNFTVENKHNIATEENGYIIHRKGATPAYRGKMSIIPGSMTENSYLIEGSGDDETASKMLNSVSHGAGRVMSRSEARRKISNAKLENHLIKSNVQTIGGDVDEHPDAYKDLDKVIDYQKEAITIKGKFKPKVVRMADD